MRYVLTPAEAAGLDRASQERGIAADTLMEAAGREVADGALRLLGGAYGRRALVVCGSTVARGEMLVRAREGLGTACAGVFTIGSFSLKLVFNTTGVPLFWEKVRIKS